MTEETAGKGRLPIGTEAEAASEAGSGERRAEAPRTQTAPHGTGRGLEHRKPLVIWGAGAMGGSIGGVWAREGWDVLFVDKAREHVEAMTEEGLKITGPVSSFQVAVEASHPEDLKGTFPLILLCVKAHHTEEAVSQLAPHLAKDGAVVSIQNGLCELEIADEVGPKRTVGAFVNFGADYLEPGVIHRGNRGAVVVGEIDGQLSERAQRIHGLLQVFEPKAVLTENIFGYLWGKLSYAALLFATALTNASIADVLDSKRHRPVLKAIAREVIAVAEARGLALEGFDGFDPHAFSGSASVGAADRSLDDLVAFNRASAKTHSGIYRDLAVRKRKTEVDSQMGPVVAFGRDSGVPTPLVVDLVRQIHEIEVGERAMTWGNLEELAKAM